MPRRSQATFPSMTRQQFLRSGGGALAAASFMSAPALRHASARQDTRITIPDSSSQLPSENVTLRIPQYGYAGAVLGCFRQRL